MSLIYRPANIKPGHEEAVGATAIVKFDRHNTIAPAARSASGDRELVGQTGARAGERPFHS
jgi:hypothetical protein